MDENMVATKDDLAVKPFSFDFGSEFISQNLPVARRKCVRADVRSERKNKQNEEDH